MTRSRIRPFLALLLLVGLAACASEPQPYEIRLATEEFELRVTADVLPPRAVEVTTYTIKVTDLATKQPVVGGEGRLFATNASGNSIWDGLAYGPEPGTYRARLKFLTAGEWAIGLQFRRDSTVPLQRTHDWRQLVRNESPST